MGKILIVSTVSRQFYLFEQGNIEVLKSMGYEVHGAANFEDANERLDSIDIIRHHIDIQRSPFSLTNIKALYQLRRLMKSYRFDAVHCHTPMGGVLARLVSRSLHVSPVIYTAHGFHFYTGAPLVNWCLYYPVEWWLSRYTDAVITINREDYERAKRSLKSQVFFVPGIGVDTSQFDHGTEKRKRKRRELGIDDDTVVLLSVGELSAGKNHSVALRAISQLKGHNIIYLICGRGKGEERLRSLCRDLGLCDTVRFLGFRNDIPEICLASDIFVFPSYREGLPVSVMEAMCAGLPIVCSAVRGNVDLVKDGIGGFLHDPDDVDGFAKSIERLIVDSDLRNEMGRTNRTVVQQYDKLVVKDFMTRIYARLLEGDQLPCREYDTD